MGKMKCLTKRLVIGLLIFVLVFGTTFAFAPSIPLIGGVVYAGEAGEKTGTEYPYYGEDPTAYTPETITMDRNSPMEWSHILYPGDTLEFTKDNDGAIPQFMGLSSTVEFSEDYGFGSGTHYITGEVNGTNEILYIYDSIVLSSEVDYALYIYGNSSGGAGLKDDPDTLGINEGHYGAYGIAQIEKIPLYIDVWYQLYNGKIPSGATANPTKILNPKETTFLKLNSAPTREGEVLDYWSNMPEYVPAGGDMPAGAVAFYPVFPPETSENDYYPDYGYNGPYTSGVSVGLTAQYKPITYTIKLGDISAYETLYGSKGFLQWYDPISMNSPDYLKSQVKFSAPSTTSWKVVGTDTRTNLTIDGTVTSDEGIDDYDYYGLRAQAPTEDYILSGWSITDSEGNELNDNYKLRMTETYAEKVNGVWNYLLCLSTNGNYFDANLADGETFIVTPIFTEAKDEITEVHLNMDALSLVGGDTYLATWEEGDDASGMRATVISTDEGKYKITKEQSTIEENGTGYIGGEYVIEPGDTLYYTVVLDANKAEGYQFSDKVGLYVNNVKITEATSDGETVRFQDALEDTAAGGVTAAKFDEVRAGDSTWSVNASFIGISRSKANLAVEPALESEYGFAQPSTLIIVAVSVNNSKYYYEYFVPQISSGSETLTVEGDAEWFGDWDYTFAGGDEVRWACYAYNYMTYNAQPSCVPHLVGSAIEGSFTVPGAPHVHNWNAPTYKWTGTGSVTATRTCKTDATHKQSETVKTTSKVSTKATCTEKGKTTYTATFKNTAFKTQTKTVTDIPATGHKWDKGKVTKAATTSATGVRTYTCTVCKATKKETIPKLPIKDAALRRIVGSDRYLTSLDIAESYMKDSGQSKAGSVIIASGKTFPDALAASYLSKAKKAPILMWKEGKDAQVQNFIKKNVKSGGTVYLLGGSSVVGDSIKKGLSGYKFIRIADSNRYGTDIKVMETAGFKKDELLVCDGTQAGNGIYALIASGTGKPVFLVPKGGLTDQQKTWLSKNKSKITKFTILGNTSSVDATVEKQLKSYGTVRRIKAANADELSAKVASEYFKNPTDITVAVNTGFADGLCGGTLAIANKGPIMLVNNSSYSKSVAYTKNLKEVKRVTVLGGTSLVSDEVTRKIGKNSKAKFTVISKK